MTRMPWAAQISHLQLTLFFASNVLHGWLMFQAMTLSCTVMSVAEAECPKNWLSGIACICDVQDWSVTCLYMFVLRGSGRQAIGALHLCRNLCNYQCKCWQNNQGRHKLSLTYVSVVCSRHAAAATQGKCLFLFVQENR